MHKANRKKPIDGKIQNENSDKTFTAVLKQIVDEAGYPEVEHQIRQNIEYVASGFSAIMLNL